MGVVCVFIAAFPGITHLLFLSEDFLRQNCACCKLRLQTQFKVLCDYYNITGENKSIDCRLLRLPSVNMYRMPDDRTNRKINLILASQPVMTLRMRRSYLTTEVKI